MINLNTFKKLPSIIRWYWFIKITTLIALFSFVLPFPLWFFAKGVLITTFFVLFIFLGLPLFVYFLLYYNSFTFVVEDGKITINSGVITKNSKSIPFDKIQNIENVKGVLHGFFGLSRVKIWTSSPEQVEARGGSTRHNPDGDLDLIIEDANWLKNFILSKRS